MNWYEQEFLVKDRIRGLTDEAKAHRLAARHEAPETGTEMPWWWSLRRLIARPGSLSIRVRATTQSSA